MIAFVFGPFGGFVFGVGFSFSLWWLVTICLEPGHFFAARFQHLVAEHRSGESPPRRARATARSGSVTTLPVRPTGLRID